MISIALGCLSGFAAYQLGHTNIAPIVGAGTFIVACVFGSMLWLDGSQEIDSERGRARHTILVGKVLLGLGALLLLLLMSAWLYAIYSLSFYLSSEAQRGFVVLGLTSLTCVATWLYLIKSET